MGSRREALRAGQTPKIRPTPIETVRPVITAQAGNRRRQAGNKQHDDSADADGQNDAQNAAEKC